MEDKTTESTQTITEATETQSEKKDEEKLFRSTDVEEIIKRRLGQAQKSWERKVELAKQQALDEFREQHMLDDETLDSLGKIDEKEKEIRANKAKATKAENEYKRLSEKYNMVSSKLKTQLTQGAVYKAASQKSNDPESVWLNIRDNLDVDEDYNLIIKDESASTIDELVDNLLATKKHLALPVNNNSGSGSKVRDIGGYGGVTEDDPRTKAGRMAILQKSILGDK